ncbi:aldolase [Zopfochytrium polystomum]|nr:aldolase [Zopfochytrium polystomum]
MSSTSTATSNRTLQILAAARDGRYGVAALTCYDAQSVIGAVRAAERCRSPAIIQLFPVTLKYGGGPFLRFCLDAARAASVPISVHLDHATTDEDVDFALTLAEQGIAFDSIMVDASHADTDEENIALTKVHVARATAAGVVVEAELGRLEGGEAGLRVVTDAQLTNPEGALTFLESTGTKILSPSVGNLHGIYLKPPAFRHDILETLRDMCEPRGYFLCLHGTDGLSDELFKECVKNGCTKINLNSWMRDPSIEYLAKAVQDGVPLPDAYDRASDVYAAVAERLMTVLGSAGKA